jgi:hypothetical protein
MRYYHILTLLLVYLLGSCNDANRCYEPVDTLMVTSFAINGFKTIDTLIINGVDRNDAGDTLVNDLGSALTKRYTLPLSLSADSTGLVLNANGIKDTLYVRHTMILSFISENCGFAPEYIISGFRYTKGIDSINISDARVNPKSIEKTTNDQNIKIYFNSAVH